jgi:SAM-dependent methyltransferase
MNKIENLYKSSYFKNRDNNDLNRQLSFENEKQFINRHATLNGTVLDIGCSTGEFLNYIDWKGDRYGIEIAKFAADQAKKNGINIVENYSKKNSLDVIIYRGTIQHLDSPFKSIYKASQSLRSKGKLFFLATPNTNSIYYRLFNSLPALDPKRNFYLPSDCSLKQIAQIFELMFLDVQYPYINSPYSKPISDHLKFLLKLCTLPCGRINKRINFAFYRSMINIVFEKK